MSRTILGGFHSQSLAVTTGVTRVQGLGATRPGTPRLSVAIQAGAADVFIGGVNVTTANGYKIAANTGISLDATDGLYITAAAGTSVIILEGF